MVAQADSWEQRKELLGGQGTPRPRRWGTLQLHGEAGGPGGSQPAARAPGTTEEDHPVEQPQDPSTVDVGRDLCGSPSPTPPPKRCASRSRCWHRSCRHGMVPRRCRGERRAQRDGASQRAAGGGNAGSEPGQQPRLRAAAHPGAQPGKAAGPHHDPGPRSAGDGVCTGGCVHPNAGSCSPQTGLGPAPGRRHRRMGPRAICWDRSGR